MSKHRRKKIFDREFVEVRNPWPKSMRHSDTYLRALPRQRRPSSELQARRKVKEYIQELVVQSGKWKLRKDQKAVIRAIWLDVCEQLIEIQKGELSTGEVTPERKWRSLQETIRLDIDDPNLLARAHRRKTDRDYWNSAR